MLSSSHSASDNATPFERLALPVQRWIRKQGWHNLRSVQEEAIGPILDGGDVIISASTASGKTEAAFLPLLTRAYSSQSSPGFKVVYISPIKALINDQHHRLESLCGELQMALYKWHGDVAASTKRRARSDPGGVLLITPESLEATLMRRGSDIQRLFGSVTAFVVDELHAFIGAERGLQLLSLMSRIEKVVGRQIDRVGLSATLGDMGLAADALRLHGRESVKLIQGHHSVAKTNLEVSIHTYVADFSVCKGKEDRAAARAGVNHSIAKTLFSDFGSSSNLIFANSRESVEVFADQLRELSNANNLPNFFYPHHGKLSKELREHAEVEIKERRNPITIIATSTLEMGVDIGSVGSVAQIDASSSVAGLRQRVGRSGRRGDSKSKLRQIVREQVKPAHSPLPSHLHFRLLASIATTELLARGWCEPPTKCGFHFSTLAHQILALIAQHSGRSAIGLYQDLCLGGPFSNVTQEMFLSLLRAMGSEEKALIEQAADGTLLLGKRGERWTEHFSFYAVFPTPDEYRIVSSEETLGTIEPDPTVLFVGGSLLFAGRRWEIVEIEQDAGLIRVKPAAAGVHPLPPGGLDIHEEVGQEVCRILRTNLVPNTLDLEGRTLLGVARTSYQGANLDTRRIQKSGKDFELYPWTGTRQLKALCAVLSAYGLKATRDWPVLYVSDCTNERLVEVLSQVSADSPPEAEGLCGKTGISTPRIEKFDYVVPADLLELAYLTERTDLTSVSRLAMFLISQASTYEFF